MDEFSRRTALFLFWFIIVFLPIPSTVGEAQQQQQQEVDRNEEEKPFFGKRMQDTVNMLYDTISVLQTSHQNAWDKVKTIIADMQLQFSPPNLEGGDEADAKGTGNIGGGGVGEKVKEAAQKSFETSKHAVEESAKTAGEALGETVHKTAEKVKETVSHAEL